MTKIYHLTDNRYPTDIRYVGKTIKKLSERLSIHLSQSNLIDKSYKNNWIKSLLNEGIKPIITLIEEVDDDIWVEREMYWISHYKSNGFNLTNSTDGGEGMNNPTEETRKKLSEASKGERNPNFGKKRTKEINDKINDVRICIHTEETKNKLSKFNKGKIISKETRQKISESNKGRIHTDETKHKMSESNKGKIISQETRQKLSDACSGEKNGFYGKEHTEETKRLLSISKTGKKLSEETKLKMSNSQKGEKNPFYGKKHTEETKLKMKKSRELRKQNK